MLFGIQVGYSTIAKRRESPGTSGDGFGVLSKHGGSQTPEKSRQPHRRLPLSAVVDDPILIPAPLAGPIQAKSMNLARWPVSQNQLKIGFFQGPFLRRRRNFAFPDFSIHFSSVLFPASLRQLPAPLRPRPFSLDPTSTHELSLCNRRNLSKFNNYLLGQSTTP